MSDSLWPHRLQHARPPCPSPTLRVYSNSCPLSLWCHPAISFPVIPFSSCLQSFPASGSFQMSWFFPSGDQSIRVSASASVFPMNIQDWFPLGWTGWISLQSRGLSRVFSNTKFKSINSSVPSFIYSPTLTSICDYWKNHILDGPLLAMSLLFNMLSRLGITFLPRSKCLNFMAAVTICSDLELQKNKISHCFYCFPIYLPWSDGTGCHDIHFLNVEL